MSETHPILEAYRDIAPRGTLDLVYKLADTVKGKTFLHVNSTRTGGGVAEMLNRLMPLFNELDIKARWEVIEGSPLFYKCTKTFHNALQGMMVNVSDELYEEYKRINTIAAQKIDLKADVAIIHDPQPAALVNFKPKNSKWVWRCHVDASRPQRKVWHFLKQYIDKYDSAIFSLPSFSQRLAIPQYLIYPSIDPLSEKSRDLTKDEIRAVLDKYKIPNDKPIILQVSRFDKFKDPLGVIRAYKLVKQYNDCCLVLAGGSADDDPEGLQVLEYVNAAAEGDPDMFILNLSPNAHHDINALQSAASVILQKSLREGFGLTVAEAMWKGKPVIGGAVGGITTQIIYGKTGFTVNSVEGCAYRVRYLLNNPDFSEKLGRRAKEYIRNNFLITRHICDYLSLINLITKN
ncbi:MAG: glycosyltransferase [Elusimicrobiota bacterium]